MLLAVSIVLATRRTYRVHTLLCKSRPASFGGMKENLRRHIELGENPGTPWGHTPPVQENNLQNVFLCLRCTLCCGF